MKILINEEKLKKIISSLINERIGVPDNITLTGRKIFDDIIQELKLIENDDVQKEINFKIHDNFQISDYNFNTVDLIINTIVSDKVDDFTIRALGFIFQSEAVSKHIKYRGDDKIVKISIDIAIPHISKIGEIIFNFNKNKNYLIPKFTHELLHSYDKFKKRIEFTNNRVEYLSNSQFSVGINPIDQFFYFLYYMSKIEKSTRASEIAAGIDLENVTKKNFLKFLEQNEVYILLNKIKNLTYSNLLSDLDPYMDEITNLMRKSGQVPELDSLSEDEKKEKFLYGVIITISHFKKSMMTNVLKINDMMSMFFPDFAENLGVLEKYKEKLKKDINNKKYFENQIKILNFDAEKAIKKIDKLYDYAKDE